MPILEFQTGDPGTPKAQGFQTGFASILEMQEFQSGSPRIRC